MKRVHLQGKFTKEETRYRYLLLSLLIRHWDLEAMPVLEMAARRTSLPAFCPNIKGLHTCQAHKPGKALDTFLPSTFSAGKNKPVSSMFPIYLHQSLAFWKPKSKPGHHRISKLEGGHTSETVPTDTEYTIYKYIYRRLEPTCTEKQGVKSVFLKCSKPGWGASQVAQW